LFVRVEVFEHRRRTRQHEGRNEQGIEVRFVDPVDPENFRKATDARTRAYYAETLPNPKLIAFPIAEVAAIGRSFGIPLVMDNTAAPILTRSFGENQQSS
jgi:O-acetylhomoserine (thiol)-lyase